MRCRRDHEEIGHALTEFADALRSRACHTLRTRFARVWSLLDDHMEWEERCLHPAFLDEAVRALREEHGTIRRLARLATRELERPILHADALTRLTEAITMLQEALREHDRAEAIQLLRRPAGAASDPRES